MPKSYLLRKLQFVYEKFVLWLRYQFFPAMKNAAIDFYVVDKVPNLAAALALFALMSFIPLLIMAVASLGYLMAGSEVAYTRVLNFVRMVTPHTISNVFPVINDLISMKNTAGWVGVIFLIWVGSRVFGILESALNRVWTLKEDRPILKRTGMALILVPGMVLFLGVSILLSAFLSILRKFEIPGIDIRIEDIPIMLSILGQMVPMIVSIGGFYLVYKIIAATHVHRKDAFIGALTAAILWEGLNRGYDYYILNIWHGGAIYGGLGTLAIFVIWVYLSSMILLFGAEVAYNWQKVEESREDNYDYLDPASQL